MNKKIKYILLAAALIIAAFFAGRNTIQAIDLNDYIPISDIAYTSTDEDDYLLLHLKDITYVDDNYSNRDYQSIVDEINED